MATNEPDWTPSEDWVTWVGDVSDLDWWVICVTWVGGWFLLLGSVGRFLWLGSVGWFLWLGYVTFVTCVNDFCDLEHVGGWVIFVTCVGDFSDLSTLLLWLGWVTLWLRWAIIVTLEGDFCDLSFVTWVCDFYDLSGSFLCVALVGDVCDLDEWFLRLWWVIFLILVGDFLLLGWMICVTWVGDFSDWVWWFPLLQ